MNCSQFIKHFTVIFCYNHKCQEVKERPKNQKGYYMFYGFTYIDNYTGMCNTENGTERFWSEMWDAERAGEIKILFVDVTIDNWKTSFEVFSNES